MLALEIQCLLWFRSRLPVEHNFKKIIKFIFGSKETLSSDNLIHIARAF